MTSDMIRVACQSFEPVTWSKQDTRKTVAQIKEHNAVYDSLCSRNGSRGR